MFNPKKSIPKLATAGLLLTGAGCGGGDGGNDGGTGGTITDGGIDGSMMDASLTSGVSATSLRASCEEQESCVGMDGVTFGYADVDECIGTVDSRYAALGPSASCISAIEALLDCSATDCTFFDTIPDNETCGVEATAKNEECM